MKELAQNADSSRIVPMQANKVDDLLKRAGVQKKRIAQHKSAEGRLGTEVAETKQEVEANLETVEGGGSGGRSSRTGRRRSV